MRKLNRLAAAAALLAAVAWGAAAHAAGGGARIVVVVHGQATDPFWSVVKNGVDAAAKDYQATVEYRAPDTFDMVQMGQLIDTAVASKPDGLVVSIPDAAALGDSIQRAVQSRIPVISMNSGANDFRKLGVTAHVGQTEFEAGQGGGQRLAAAGVTEALCVNQEVGNVALDQRCDGFKAGLGSKGRVEVLAVPMDPTAVSSAVTAALQKNPKINGILALGPVAADPTLAALEQSGKLSSVKLATFDLSPNVLAAIRDGQMLFAIDQQQYLQGYLPVAFLALNKKFGTLPTGIVMTGPGFVEKDNAAQVIDLSKQGIR